MVSLEESKEIGERILKQIEEEFVLPDIRDVNSPEVQDLLDFVKENLGVEFELELDPKIKASWAYPTEKKIRLGKRTLGRIPAGQWIALIHEALHLTGLKHNRLTREEGYYSTTYPSVDSYSAEKTLELLKEYYKGLTEPEKRYLEFLKGIIDVLEPPEVVMVDGTKTVIAEYMGEKINVAIGEVKKREQFEPLSIKGTIIQVKKSPALEAIRKKLKEKKKVEQITFRPELGALDRIAKEERKRALRAIKEAWEKYPFNKGD